MGVWVVGLVQAVDLKELFLNFLKQSSKADLKGLAFPNEKLQEAVACATPVRVDQSRPREKKEH